MLGVTLFVWCAAAEMESFRKHKDGQIETWLTHTIQQLHLPLQKDDCLTSANDISLRVFSARPLRSADCEHSPISIVGVFTVAELWGLSNNTLKGAEVDEEKRWIVNSVRLDESDNLVIDARPGYANRKKWGGEMIFRLQPDHVTDLLNQINERNANERMRAVAADELREFLELFKVEYLEKRQFLAEKLNLDLQDIPTPHWWSMNSPNVSVTIDVG